MSSDESPDLSKSPAFITPKKQDVDDDGATGDGVNIKLSDFDLLAAFLQRDFGFTAMGTGPGSSRHFLTEILAVEETADFATMTNEEIAESVNDANWNMTKPKTKLFCRRICAVRDFYRGGHEMTMEMDFSAVAKVILTAQQQGSASHSSTSKYRLSSNFVKLEPASLKKHDSENIGMFMRWLKELIMLLRLIAPGAARVATMTKEQARLRFVECPEDVQLLYDILAYVCYDTTIEFIVDENEERRDGWAVMVAIQAHHSEPKRKRMTERLSFHLGNHKYPAAAAAELLYQ